MVGPGLGNDSIEAGKKATLVAGALVIIFMFATYGVFGFFANIALLVHVGLILGLMSVLEATMTLPGIAGIVLTIGTAVDSNVLIYERVARRGEGGALHRLGPAGRLRQGLRHHHRFELDHGHRRRDPVLPRLRPVKGFAVVFILGILTTVITAVTLTRMMIALWYNYARPKALPF